MKQDSFEAADVMNEAQNPLTLMEVSEQYKQYVESGGIINEKDFRNALSGAEIATEPDKQAVLQSESMAAFAGIELHNTKDSIDRRSALYARLRADAKPKDAEYHHSQMSDQRLFAEALRMIGDVDALKKFIAAYPNISFDYKKENPVKE